MDITKRKIAPLTPAQREQLRTDANNVRAAANRKQITLDKWEERTEALYAKKYFVLGCWLFYYANRIGRSDALADRIDCLRRIFEAGLHRLNYQMFTVFEFGERHYDTLVEMGDAKEVIAGVRKYITDTPEGHNIRAAFEYLGWPTEPDPLFSFSVEVRYRTHSGCNTTIVKVEATGFSEAIKLATDAVRKRRGVVKIDGGDAVQLS